jgi:hypothetical protein
VALTTNLVSYWKLDETSGSSAADAVGGNSGTLKSNTSFTTNGKINGGVTLTTSNPNGIDVGTPASLDLTQYPLSISAWIKTTAVSPIFVSSTHTASTYYRYDLSLGRNVNGKPDITYVNSSGTEYTLNGPNTVNDGAWHHIVGTISATGAMKLYVDGSLVASGLTATGTLLTGKKFTLGDNWPLDGSSSLNGTLDEVGVWSRELTATEVTTLYNGGAGLQYPFATTYNQTVAAVGAGIAAISNLKIRGVVVAAIGSIVATVSKNTTFTRAAAAIGNGVADAKKLIFKVIAAIGNGIATSIDWRPIEISINGLDYAEQIDWASFSKTEVLTSQPDSCTFMLRNVAGKTYRPVLNDDVKIYRNGTLIFGGVVISTTETIAGLVRYFTVQCKDYTEILDGVLIAKSYTSMTAADIIADLVSNFTSGFTTVNVVAPFTVDAISFNYISLSQCLQQLATAIPGYDWYVDYDKDIHFFMPASNAAPFSLDEITTGNFLAGSLEFDADMSQIRNSIVVRGGNVVGAAATNSQVSDGTQVIFYVGYSLSTFTAKHALAATPTTFVDLTVGVDGVDAPASFDCLYNPDLGLLRFPSAYPSGDVVKTSGTPTFPLITILGDPVSQAAYGMKEYMILDKTITTKQQSIDRANAQLAQYAQPLYTGKFITLKDGLVQGQTISINLPSRGISGTFKIQQIDTTLRTPSGATADLIYSVQFVSAFNIGIIELLNKILIQDQASQIEVSSNEVPNRIYAPIETMTVADLISVAIDTPQTETITAVEASNAAKDAGTVFVVGPYTPTGFSDTKRVFILNGSRLG